MGGAAAPTAPLNTSLPKSQILVLLMENFDFLILFKRFLRVELILTIFNSEIDNFIKI